MLRLQVGQLHGQRSGSELLGLRPLLAARTPYARSPQRQPPSTAAALAGHARARSHLVQQPSVLCVQLLLPAHGRPQVKKVLQEDFDLLRHAGHERHGLRACTSGLGVFVVRHPAACMCVSVSSCVCGVRNMCVT